MQSPDLKALYGGIAGQLRGADEAVPHAFKGI
jgi:hypothetical protein